MFDFKTFFVSYGEYHYNPINKWIHIIFIPTNTFTYFVFALYWTLFQLPLQGYLVDVDLAILFFFLLLCPLYLMVQFFSGLVTTVFFVGAYVVALQLN